MKIRLRLTLLLGCLLAVFGGFAWLIRLSHAQEAQELLEGLRNEREVMLGRLLELTGQSLKSFATDYARWDEMVNFLKTADPAWAAVNLEQSLPNFNAHAAWVFTPEGKLFYETSAPPLHAPLELPASLVAQLVQTTHQDLRHCFWDSPQGLIELRMAAIVPSDYVTNPSPTLGWWVVARLWNKDYLDHLAQPLQGLVYLNGDTPPPPSSISLRLERKLLDWDRQPVQVLHTRYEPAAITNLLESNDTESYLFYGFALILLLLTVAGLSRWVLAPLRRLEQSLATGNSAPLQPLLGHQHEFGHLARLVEQSFSQRDALQREIAEREKAEAGLRQSKELHNRLARDLHDGAIQSIYAAGLGLENMRALLLSDPVAAEQRLDACLRSFNQTIASIRSFIYGLESDADQPQTLEQSMTALVQTMRSLQPVPITLAIDNQLTQPLTDAQEIHLLQILRESLSNALRHSQAHHIAITFTADRQGACRLTIIDDGCSFDPAEKTGRGHGLANLTTRARELGGELFIESTPGKGTRLTVSFSHSATS